MKNVRSSQPCTSMNFCTEFSKAQVLLRVLLTDVNSLIAKWKFAKGQFFFFDKEFSSKVLLLIYNSRLEFNPNFKVNSIF